jgi:ribose transport system substrate-binding protein
MRITITAIITTLLVLTGCGRGAAPTEGGTAIRVAYVTNGIDPFWTIAEAGALAAARDLGVQCEVLMPPRGLVDQTRMIESLLARNIDGIAISPIDAANQVNMINDAAARTVVITQDSDAPDSDRLCFIGMNNYLAGRDAGKLVKDAMPDGGSVMIFVGRLEQLNAQQRRQGVIDELLDRPVADVNSLEFDPPGFTHLDGKYPILGTRTDNFDYARAKANAEDAMASHPDLGCMVGLFAYNIPNCLEAVRAAGKTGQIQLVSFDEADDTLNGIRDGHVHGTISQQPFEYGYQSVKVLKALIEGDESVIPADGFIEVPSIVVTRDNVDPFQARLNELRGG